jgi:hypothetical protein
LIFLVFLFAVVALGILCGMFELLLKHRREMARIVHKRSEKGDGRIESLEKRIAELTEIVHDQTLILESLNSRTLATRDAEGRLRV